MTIEDARAEFLNLLEELAQKKKLFSEVNGRTNSRENDQELAGINLRVQALLELLNALADKLTDFFIGRRTKACFKSALSEAIYAAIGGNVPDEATKRTINRQPN